MFKLREVFNALSAARLFGDGGLHINGISTDSRKIATGDLFVALRGEKFDANEFAPQARAQGAAAVLVDRWIDGLQAPAILVGDSRRALGEIAIAWRRRFAIPVIAVTGSNGKTTVKEMIAAILAEQFGEQQRWATQGNLNNDIGVPLSVFRLNGQHRAAVLELGMNHPGEIAWIASIAQANVALVNNAQREHQEFMPSIEATAIENGAAIQALAADGIAVFPGDDEHRAIWREQAGSRRCIEFGLSADTTTSALTVWAPPQSQPNGFTMSIGRDKVDVALQIAGVHNVRNALAAAACCYAIGTPVAMIAAGLARFTPVKGRLVGHRLANGAHLIDDSYNANPDSVRAAIDVLADRPAPRVLVLGDMGEVGEHGVAYHREVGEYARTKGVEHVLAFGDASRDVVTSFGQSAEHFEDLDRLLERTRMLATAEATVLVKGSRFMKMERIINFLLERVN